MNVAHLLDDLVTGASVRAIGSDRQSPQARRVRKHVGGLLRTAAEAARSVASEADYQAWYTQHGEPVFTAASESRSVLGYCMGDEGLELCELVDKLFAATHRPGWRCEP